LDFIELKVNVPPDFSDILLAELAEIGFESFVDTSYGLDGYIPATVFDEQQVAAIREKYSHVTSVTYTYSVIGRKNWNEEWEKSYAPIVIGEQCLVRASFHQGLGSYAYEIIINPKMSFGTGHHETTSLMLENQLHIVHTGKRVLDIGCGTGILAIMACKRGAARADAFDTDEWAVENSRENFELNNCRQATVQQGTVREVKLAPGYDILLANINRNVLLDEMPVYASLLTSGGFLLLSGFYEKDIADIEKMAITQGFIKTAQRIKRPWASLVLKKQIAISRESKLS
jgi:ribosomal protein L11 methyltransferase